MKISLEVKSRQYTMALEKLIFYQEKRYKYIVECRDAMLLIQNEVKGFFNLLTKARY